MSILSIESKEPTKNKDGRLSENNIKKLSVTSPKEKNLELHIELNEFFRTLWFQQKLNSDIIVIF